MTERERINLERLENRLEFETLISDTSASLFASAPERLDLAIESTLEQVREFFGADRCALLAVGADHTVVNLRLASYGAGISHVPSDANLVPLFPWAARQLLVERVPVRISRMSDLPPEADSDRPGWYQLQTRSSLALPIETDGTVRHMIVIQSVREERDWPDVLVTRLRVLGELIVGALERRIAEDAFRRSEARLASGAALAGLAYYEMDFGEGLAYVDDRLREMVGIPQGAAQALQVLDHWVEHLHPDDRARVLEMRKRLHGGTVDSISIEYRFLHPIRGQQWMHHLARVATRDASGRAIVSYGVIRDITKSKIADEQIRDFGRRLIHAQEQDRALLARDLHDDVTQRLAVLAIDVGRAELAATDPAQARTMRTVRDGLVRLSEDVHALAYQLHPSVLVELGLDEALRAESERFGQRSGVALSLDLDPVPAWLGRDAALCAFRVAQEALNNIVRHADARAASLTLRSMDGGMLVAVRDDGVGFDAEDPATRRTLGLVSMRERVHAAGGTLDIESSPGQGTAVFAWVPGHGEQR